MSFTRHAGEKTWRATQKEITAVDLQQSFLGKTRRFWATKLISEYVGDVIGTWPEKKSRIDLSNFDLFSGSKLKAIWEIL